MMAGPSLRQLLVAANNRFSIWNASVRSLEDYIRQLPDESPEAALAEAHLATARRNAAEAQVEVNRLKALIASPGN